MSEIKLKAKDMDGNDVEFDVGKSLDPVDQSGWVSVYQGDAIGSWTFIYPATIQLADDPRKQMLDEIRVRLSKAWWIHSTTGALVGYDKQQVDEILDEMEAKL